MLSRRKREGAMMTSMIEKTVRKIRSANKSAKIELLFPLYVLLILGASTMNEEGYFGITLSKWLATFAISFILVVIIVIFAHKRLGTHDFRFKALPHMFLIAYSAAIMGMSVAKTDILAPLLQSIGTSGFWDQFFTAMMTYMILSIPALIFVIAGFYGLFSITDPYIQSFNEVSKVVKKGDFTIQISDEHILNDSVFGPIASFFNDVISTASLLIERMARLNSILIQTSRGIANLSEELSNASEVVNSSTESLSTGAQEQVNVVSVVSEELFDLTQQVETVMNDIKKNATTAAQIATQMTILSLNASIEAARAGTEHQAFIVVANNIRTLASNSKESARTIHEVARVIEEKLHATFVKVKESMENINAVAEENAASIEEISASMQDLASNMHDLLELAQHLTSKADESHDLIANLHHVATTTTVN